MDKIYLLKLGEIHLKGENRKEFIGQLRANLRQRLHGIAHRLVVREGRFYLHAAPEWQPAVARVLDRLPGINAWAECRQCAKDMDSIIQAGIDAFREAHTAGARSFKVESRRADKGFPLQSYAISRELGHHICLAYPDVRVDVHAPASTVHVEVRDHAFVYTDGHRGVRGLPVGCAGTGLLLLSGGIDSPVAGFSMLRRGLAIEAIHFNAYPYTSREAWEKVHRLATVLAGFSGRLLLHTLSFTEVQLAIREAAPSNCATLFLRAAMMHAADRLAASRGLNSLITGESLSQVASQTAENLRFSQSPTSLPVFRPLIGTDKEDIIATARRIGSYDISIEPYEDCCVLFSPRYPILKAVYERERQRYAAIGLEEKIQAAVAACETIEVSEDLVSLGGNL